jgi:SAM-dependent methyltransferase
METLPWPAEAFGLVRGFNAFQYAADPSRALGEARRVLRAGSRLLVCRWAEPAVTDLFRMLGELSGRAIGPGPAEAGVVAGEPVRALVRAAGLTEERTGVVRTALRCSKLAALLVTLRRSGAIGDGRVEALRGERAAASVARTGPTCCQTCWCTWWPSRPAGQLRRSELGS